MNRRPPVRSAVFSATTDQDETMSDYTLTQREYSRLKRRLTFRLNRLKKADEDVLALKGRETREDKQHVINMANQVIRECEYAKGIFEEKGFPDGHSRWDRIKDDAMLIKRRMV